MTLEDIIGIADEAYPDGLVGQYFREPEGKHGDTLAKFMAVELRETYDGNVPDADQLDTASRAMETAARELQNVADVLKLQTLL